KPEPGAAEPQPGPRAAPARVPVWPVIVAFVVAIVGSLFVGGGVVLLWTAAWFAKGWPGAPDLQGILHGAAGLVFSAEGLAGRPPRAAPPGEPRAGRGRAGGACVRAPPPRPGARRRRDPRGHDRRRPRRRPCGGPGPPPRGRAGQGRAGAPREGVVDRLPGL